MSVLSKTSLLVALTLAALPFAACSGTTAGAGTPCAALCQDTEVCFNTSTQSCVLADPAGEQAACVDACVAGFAALTPAESTLVTACFQCGLQAAAGKCFEDLPSGTCATECNSAPAQAATNKFGTASTVPATPASLCTNGMNTLGSTTCTGGGDGTSSCSNACCNGSSCATPDVAVSCTGANLDTCTCTAGKNSGKTVQAPMCVGDLWTLCNL